MTQGAHVRFAGPPTRRGQASSHLSRWCASSCGDPDTCSAASGVGVCEQHSFVLQSGLNYRVGACIPGSGLAHRSAISAMAGGVCAPSPEGLSIRPRVGLPTPGQDQWLVSQDQIPEIHALCRISMVSEAVLSLPTLVRSAAAVPRPLASVVPAPYRSLMPSSTSVTRLEICAAISEGRFTPISQGRCQHGHSRSKRLVSEIERK